MEQAAGFRFFLIGKMLIFQVFREACGFFAHGDMVRRAREETTADADSTLERLADKASFSQDFGKTMLFLTGEWNL